MNRTRPVLKRLLLRTAAALQIDSLLRRLRAREGAVLILNLHRVSPDWNPYWPPLHPDLFDQLLAFLRPHCRFVNFAALRDEANGRDSTPLAVLSFDDGYSDFLEYAVPIMESHGVSANLN